MRGGGAVLTGACTMTDEAYREALDRLTMAAALLEGVDLAGMLARIDRCLAEAPALDPSLFLRGAARLTAVQALAHAGLDVQTAGARLRAVNAEEGARRAAAAGTAPHPALRTALQ